MAVKDFMTTDVVCISATTTVAKAADLMREKGLRRLPVVEKDKLIGLITATTMAEAMPSKATSLSIYEMNYLLNKTIVRDIMIKQVVTVSGYQQLEDAIYLMMKHKIGVLPVVEQGAVKGIITDRDIFKAFLEVSGYGKEGIRAILLAEDTVGTLSKVSQTIADVNLNITRIVVAQRQTGKVVIEIQMQGKTDLAYLSQQLQTKGVIVESLELTHDYEIV